MRILVNHIGYDTGGVKRAILQTITGEAETGISGGGIPDLPGEREFVLINTAAGKNSFCGKIGAPVTVPGWKSRVFHRIDFSSFREPGLYRLEVPGTDIEPSAPFEIRKGILFQECVSDILFYYKSQRSSGIWDRADRKAPFYGEREGTADVHGGWFDASGDYSKYLSHLSYANYLNPQQTPLAVWSLLNLTEVLGRSEQYGGTLLEERAIEEALLGADFLVRMQDPEGYFYTTVFDKWDKIPGHRMICAFRGMEGERLSGYEAGFRQGGGMSIAALAKASGLSLEFPEVYLKIAEKGYHHLLEKNTVYLDNGRENIIDYYCALLGAVELFRATGKEFYLKECRRWAENLGACWSEENNCFMVEKGSGPGSGRPFFHASDAGLPLLSLIKYLRIESCDKHRKVNFELVKKSALSELAVTGEVENPFGLARQTVKPVDGPVRTSFFIPHENESGYWWQGENARLASLSCAMRAAADMFPLDDHIGEMNEYADSQLNWILGLNPFDICMFGGKGRNNPKYEDDFPNAPGGICNGITGGFRDEPDIDFLPVDVINVGDHRWRWSEQWIPHAAWFIMALSEKNTRIEN